MSPNEQNEPSKNTLFRQGIIACFPTILGYWSIGFAAGAIGSLTGFSVLDIGLLSAFLYAGSAQFLFYSLHAEGASVLPIIIGVLLINMRYLLMSSYMAMYFRRASVLQKLVSGALLTDETFSVAAQYASRHGLLPFAWLLGLNLTAWLNWIVANLAGAVLASSLPASISGALNFSLVSMFIGLLVMTWFASQRREAETVTIGAAVLIVWGTSGHVTANLSVIIATLGAATFVTGMMRSTRPADLSS